MTEKSQSELEELHGAVDAYGAFALRMLEESITALETKDIGLARAVAGRRAELKTRFIPVEDAYFQYLALYHPVARDMRECVASIRIIYNLERIGRMGFDIAQTTITLTECCGVADPTALVVMGRRVTGMIGDALGAFRERSPIRIADMSERDKEIDSLYCSVMAGYIRQMQNQKDIVPILTRFVIIDRYLERCGDQACNMAEMIVYMVTGERVEIR